MADWSDLRNMSSAAGIASFALKLAEKFQGPRPELRLRVRFMGGAEGHLAFLATVSEIRNQVPALDVRIVAGFEGEEGKIFEEQPFDLSAGQLNKEKAIPVRRPEDGDLVPACNNAPTLYGRELVVTAYSENGGVDVAWWKEEEYDPVTDRGRYEAMQRAWRFARGEDTADDRRAEHRSEIIRRRDG